MSRHSLVALASTAALGFVVLVLIGVELLVWRPYRRLYDPDFMQTATDDEIRQTAHAALAFPLCRDHDACFALISVGNRQSIPYLKQARRRNWHPSGVVPCTFEHCRDALMASRTR
ncbi:MAG: hypothetical protein ACOC1F_09135 [Myxococcota bacterium]